MSLGQPGWHDARVNSPLPWLALAACIASTGTPCQGWSRPVAPADPRLPAGWRVISAGPGTTGVHVEGEVVRLSLDTRGAAPHPLTVAALATQRPVPFARLSWTLDWQGVQNTSYLKTGVYLSPHRTDGDPAALPDWIRIEYVGVPPGDRWRYAIGERRDGGVVRFLDQAGWPAARGGRALAPVDAQWTLRDGTLQYAEATGVRSDVPAPPWPQIYVYVAASGHSNYPLRAVALRALHLEVP